MTNNIYNEINQREAEMFIMFILIPLFLTLLIGLVLLQSYRSNPAKLTNGVLFMLFIISIIITISMAVISLNYNWLIGAYIILLIISVLIIIGLYYFQGLLWLWNAWIVWHHENHSLANSLTLIIGILTILFPIINGRIAINSFIRTFVILILLYIIFCIFSFTSIVMLFNLIKPKANKRFIIILGAGLLNGNQVSPLLASRVNKGIEFFHKVERKSNFQPLLICSGGKGSDETIPEGEAMRQYAIEHGINPNYVVAEKQSKTTLQNMIFSKKIVDKHHLPLNSGVYVSNDYHIFRAGIYAQKAGFKIQGLGVKTSRFFVPNAIIREYIALFANHKWFHIIVIIIILIISSIISFTL